MLLNQGGGTFVTRDLGLLDDDRVMDWLDANGDGRVDLLTRERRGSGSGPCTEWNKGFAVLRSSSCVAPTRCVLGGHQWLHQ